MKIIALAVAGLVGTAAAVTPVPAEAQRYGYNGYYGSGYNDGYRRDYRRDRHWRGDRRWSSSRRHRTHSYVRCHYVRGYYGRQRQCYRVYR